MDQLTALWNQDPRTEVGGDADQHCRQTDKTVQDGDHFRHRCHRDPGRQDRPDQCADSDCCGEYGGSGCVTQKNAAEVFSNPIRKLHLAEDQQCRGTDGQRHADDSVQVSTARSLLVGQTTEAQDEEHRRHQVGTEDRSVRNHDFPLISGTSSACAG